MKNRRISRQTFAIRTADDTSRPGEILRTRRATTADVALGKSFVDVKSLEARGGAFHILGRYHKAKESSDGVFLIDAGPLAIGVGLSGGESQLQLVESRSWFREHMAR